MKTKRRLRKVVPKVGVVIVNYRTPALTIDCVQSLETVTNCLLDIIVVDNGSTPSSIAPLRLGLPNDVCLVESTENGGYTGGNNIGIQRALDRGADAVLILNPDTVVCNPNFVDNLITHLEENPLVGAAGPKVFIGEPGRVQNTVLEFPWVGRRVVNWFRQRIKRTPARSGNQTRSAEALNGVCVLFRRKCLLDVGVFDQSIFAYIEDIDWAWRAKKLGWSIDYVPTTSIVHLQKESGYERFGAVDFLLKRNTFYFFVKHGFYLQSIVYMFFVMLLGLVLLPQTIARRQFHRLADWMCNLLLKFSQISLGFRQQVLGLPYHYQRKASS